jgi:hypothetical protein
MSIEARLALFALGNPSGHGVIVGLHHDVGGHNPVCRYRDWSAVNVDSHRFVRAGQNPVGAAVGRVQRAPYCILSEEDVDRVCQVLVDENGRGGVARCRDGQQLLEVASEQRDDLRWVPGGG